MNADGLHVGRVTLSDRAFAGEYSDKSGPEIERLVRDLFEDDIHFHVFILPDEQPQIEAALIELTDAQQCQLVITTGGTGPSKRDVTPEATRAVLEKELPGFGELMRMKSYEIVPTAILSRAVAGTRGHSLLINLPGSPRAIGECLGLLGPAIAECLDHLAGVRPTLRRGVPIQ